MTREDARKMKPETTIRHALLAVLVLTTSGRDAAAQYAPTSASLISANFTQLTDSLGFRWDVNQAGAIGDGSDDAFDGGFTLRIGNTQFQSTTRQMVSSTNEYVLTGKIGTVNVVRRVKIDAQRSVVRYVESFSNPTSAVQTISFTIYTDLGTTPQSMLTTGGRVALGPLSKKENAVVCTQQPNYSRPSVVMYFGSLGSKIKPSLSRSGDDITVTVTLTVRPGKTVSFLHAGAQRRFTAAPTAKEIAALVKPLENSEFVKDLPAAIRRTIVNYGTVLFGGGLGEDSLLKHDIREALGIQPQTTDLLAIGESSRLRGSALCERLTIATSFGEHAIAWDDVAAVVGHRGLGTVDKLYLRDGQVLSGELSMTGLRFSTLVGSSTPLRPEALDRLILRRQPKRSLPEGNVYMVTHRGDRIAVTFADEARLPLLTMWGRVQLRLAAVAWLVPSDQDVPGYQVRLKNGSRFFAYLPETELPVESQIMGSRRLATSEMLGFVAAEFTDPEVQDESLKHRPRVLLRGGQVLVGGLVEDAVDFQTEGQALLVPRDAIRLMRRRDEDAQQTPPSLAQFVALLWSGDVIVGNLREGVFAVLVDDQRFTVPARDLLEVHSPSARLTPSGREGILQLIGDLGDRRWKRRAQATRELSEIGFLAVPLLREAARNSEDPEVRRRAVALVELLDIPVATDAP